MASNALKRIFGETKLELKLLLLFGIGLLVIIVTAFWWYGRSTAELVYSKNQDAGKALVGLHMLSNHFWEMEARKFDSRFAVPEASPEEERESREKETLWLKGLLKDFVSSSHETKLLYYWQNAENSGPENDFEKKLCDYYMKYDPENAEFKEQFIDGNSKYQYFRPIYVQESCMRCHATTPSGIDAAGSGISFAGQPAKPDSRGWQVGDLMAVAKVTIPNQSMQRKLNENWALLWTFAIGTVFLGVLTSYAIVRYVIVKPLRHLRDVSDAVSRGNIALRAEIHTGDEFEELATAFNRMLRHTGHATRTNCGRPTSISTARSTSWPRPTCGSTR